MPSIQDELQEIFRDVLNDPELVLTAALTPEQVSGWDSLAQVRIVIGVESQFGIKFSIAEALELTSVGGYLNTIADKIGRA